MSSIKKSLARRAAKSTAKHTACGTASRLKRSPIRVVTLLGVGTAIGAVVGWLFGRNGAAAKAT